MKKVYVLLLLMLFCILSPTADAQWRIRAVFLNPPTPGNDDGREYIEIEGPANTNLTNLTFLEIEGDGTTAGIIDRVAPLDAFVTGSKGLLLIRDNAAVLQPAPSPETSVSVTDFAPDLENGTVTFMIVSGFTGSAGQDLDTDNDGTLNTTPWSAVYSAVSVTDGTAGDGQYADDVGGTNIGIVTVTLDRNIVFFYKNRYYAAEVSGSGNGPFTINNGGAWYGLTGSTTVDATMNGIEITPGRAEAPLPSTLLFFNAAVFNKKVQLNWRTASESNTDRFEVQRSSNGIKYETIGSVRAAGNSGTLKTYSYSDNTASGSQLYYRLRMVDIDNKENFSSIYRIRLGPGRIIIHNLYPRPAGLSIKMEWNSTVDADAGISVINVSGQQVLNRRVKALKGYNLTDLDVGGLAKGQYMLRLQVADEILTEKFIKQ
jgi:hypothetical protein